MFRFVMSTLLFNAVSMERFTIHFGFRFFGFFLETVQKHISFLPFESTKPRTASLPTSRDTGGPPTTAITRDYVRFVLGIVCTVQKASRLQC